MTKTWKADLELVPRLAGEVKASLGINLMASTPSDIVHGHTKTIHKQPGHPFWTIKATGQPDVVVDECPYCLNVIPREDAHECVKVTLYEQYDESPNDVHESTQKKVTLTDTQRKTLSTIVAKYRGGA